MTRSHPLFLVLALALFVGGCSDQNADVREAHPDGWVLTHGGEADDDLGSCTACHGTDFNGGTVGVSCYDCHIGGPPFKTHPSTWDDALADHQSFATDFSWTSCATSACHGKDLRGGHGSGETGPSCFSDSFEGDGCHALGPPAPHADDYLPPANHGADAKSQQLVCRNCHGRPENVFDGGYITDPAILDNALGNCSTSTCHPDATSHPTNWQGSNDDDTSANYYSTHRTIQPEAVDESCALCHNTETDAAGPFPGAPSCFAAEFTNADGSTTGCHADGPGQAPHPLDGSYLAPAAHGPDAQADLTACQDCHGEPGGPGSNPRFNVGIFRVSGTGCESAACHDVNYAHPTAWAGPNPTDHYAAGNIDNACTLCHGVDLDGEGGVGGSCLGCHTSVETFALDCTFCHGYPPDGSAEPVVGGTPVDHAGVPLGPHDDCIFCHGVKDTGSGMFSAAPAYSLYNRQDDVPGDHWDGNLQMNGPSPDTGAGYNEANFGCDNAACHGNDATHQMSDSELALAFGDYGAGGSSAPHPVDGSYLAPSAHGPDAKADLTFCQPCHAEPGDGAPGSDPRFNVAIGNLAAGCESSGCHAETTAHPTDWQGVDGSTTHRTAGNLSAACGLCHGATLAGGVGPSCSSGSYTNANGSATSCHANGPGVLPFHPGGWENSHVEVARVDVSSCLAECHADSTETTGGIPGCAVCHLGGATTTAPSRIMHPDGDPIARDFGANAIGPHQDYVDDDLDGDATSCALSYCHGEDLTGGTAPLNNSWGDGNTCFQCHGKEWDTP